MPPNTPELYGIYLAPLHRLVKSITEAAASAVLSFDEGLVQEIKMAVHSIRAVMAVMVRLFMDKVFYG